MTRCVRAWRNITNEYNHRPNTNNFDLTIIVVKKTAFKNDSNYFRETLQYTTFLHSQVLVFAVTAWILYVLSSVPCLLTYQAAEEAAAAAAATTL